MNNKIQKINEVYATSDGVGCKTLEEAMRRQDMLDALEAFDNAKVHLCRCISQTQKTKDGKPFEFGYATYYVVKAHPVPIILPITIPNRSYKYDFRFESGELEIMAYNKEWYFVRELYKDENEALKALMVEQEKEIRQLRDERNKVGEILLKREKEQS